MSVVIKVLYVIYSPVLVMLYWRNSMRGLDNIHAPYEIGYVD